MHIAKGRLVPAPAGAFVRVVRGALWLTQFPDRNDYVLVAGESMWLSATGRPLVTALEDSEIRLRAA